jgi:DNA-binding beta-propeller fold protein YncE
MGIGLIFRDMVSDADGIYVSQQGFTHSVVDRIDPTTGALVELATPEGSNDYVHLALTDSTLYFEALESLYGIPRSGGSPITVLASQSKTGQMLVVGARLFVNETSTRPLAEIDMTSGTITEHERAITGMVRDGSDIYFTQADGVYVAPGANFATVQPLVAGKFTLLGVAGNAVYLFAGSEVRRLPKTGGETQAVMSVDPQGKVALANDMLVFTQSAPDRVYVCTAGLDGTRPTVHGYLPAGVPSMLNADANYVYAVHGFYMVRFGR